MPGLWRTQANRVQSVMVEVCWRPAQGDTSGDFHDVIDLLDGRVAVVLGDAPSFGKAAAELGDELLYELRKELKRSGQAPFALRHVDEVIAARGTDTIATAVCGVFDPNEQQLKVTNAGHLPILMASGTEARFLEKRVDPPLGVTTNRQAVAYPVPHDTSVFFLTDGVMERRGASLDEGLAVALACCRGPTGAIVGATELALRISEHLGQATDDATVISVQLRPLAPPGINAQPYHLRLFVDPADERSIQAENLARHLVARMDGLIEIDLEVVDITVAAHAADEEGVFAFPTVVRVTPAPSIHVVGNLQSPAELARALQLPPAGGVDT